MLDLIFLILSGLLCAFIGKELLRPGPIFAVIAILIGLGVFNAGIHSYQHTWRIIHHYQQGNCVVVNQMPDTTHAAQNDQTAQQPSHLYCSTVLLRLTLADKNFDNTVSAGCANDPAGQKNLLAAYPIGQTRACWYDPQDLTQIQFDHNANFTSAYMLIGFGIFLVCWIVFHLISPAAPKISLPFAESFIPSSDVSKTAAINPEATDNQTILKELGSFTKNPNDPNLQADLLKKLNARGMLPDPADKTINVTNPIAKAGVLWLLGKSAEMAQKYPSVELTQAPPAKTTLGQRAGILLVCLMFLSVSLWMLKQEWDTNHRYISTTCTVLDKKFNRHFGSKSTQYSASFYLSYQAGGVTYKQWHSASILTTSSNMLSHEMRIFNRYITNETYPCWYDPNLPSTVVLEHGYSFWAILFAAFSIGVTILCLLPSKRGP